MLLRAVISLLLLLCSTNSIPIYAQTPSSHIRFQEDYWYQILQQAQQANKHVFVVVHADYCLPCRKMEQQVFTHSKVANFHNTFFINYNVNLSKKDKHDFIKRHTIRELPTFLYFSPQGRLLWKTTGEKDVKQLLDIGKQVILKSAIPIKKNTTSKVKSLHELQQQYHTGNRNPELLKDLAYALRMNHQPYHHIVDQYLQQQSDLKTIENREFIFENANDLNSKAIDYLLKDLAFFKEYYSPQTVNEKLRNTIYNGVITAIQESNPTHFQQTQQVIKAAHLPNSQQFSFEMTSLYYQSTNNWKAYAKNAQQYLYKRPSSNPKLLNDIARNFCHHITDKKMLLHAIDWIITSIAIENEYYNNETYALLMYKVGQHKLAKQVAQKAIRIAQIRGNDHQTAIRLIHTINQNNK